MTPVESNSEPLSSVALSGKSETVGRYLIGRMRWDFLATCCCFGALLGLGLMQIPRGGWSSGRFEFFSVVSIFALTHLLASCFHYVPRGADNGLIRLSLAAFCRTFVPLLALISIHNYIFQLLNEANAGSIVAAYMLSLALTLVAAFRGSN